MEILDYIVLFGIALSICTAFLSIFFACVFEETKSALTLCYISGGIIVLTLIIAL